MDLINKKVLDTLKPLNVPIGYLKYSGEEDIYITFHEYLQSGDDFEDDEEVFTGHYVQVDVWSKTDYTELVKNIKSYLKLAGFKRLDESDFYEIDTDLYHKGIRFFYLESKEEI